MEGREVFGQKWRNLLYKFKGNWTMVFGKVGCIICDSMARLIWKCIGILCMIMNSVRAVLYQMGYMHFMLLVVVSLDHQIYVIILQFWFACEAMSNTYTIAYIF